MHNPRFNATLVFKCAKSLCSPPDFLYSLTHGAILRGDVLGDDMIEALSFAVAHGAPRLTCGIIFSTWPAWWYAVLACGLEPSWLLPLGPMAEAACTAINGRVLKGDVQRASTVDVLLLDVGDMSVKIDWASCPAKVVLSMNRSVPVLRKRWHRCMWELSHNQLGGVSTATARLYAYTPFRDIIRAWQPMVFPRRYSPTLHSVLKCTISSGVAVNAVDRSIPTGSDYYDLEAQLDVSAPCVFGGMRLRPLDSGEMADVLDFPASFASACSSTVFEHLLKVCRTPLKLYSVPLMHLLVLRSGGGEFSSLSGDEEMRDGVMRDEARVRNLAVEEEESVVEEGVGKLKELGGTNLEGKRKKCDGIELNKEGLMREKGKAEGKEEQVMDRNRTAVKSEGKVEQVMDRNSTAVKSDAAAVPTYLWRENLLRGLQERASSSPFALGLISDLEFEQHATVLRDKFLLPCWRKNVLRSFLTYCRDRHSEQLQSSISLLRWNEAQRCYTWAPFGRQVYQDRWRQRRARYGADMAGGFDCLQRVADATWWDWKGGSRPFFWRWSKERLGNDTYVTELRDGMPVLYDEKALPNFRKAQSPPRTDEDREKVSSKLRKFINRRYIVYSVAAAVLSYISFFYVPKGEDDIRVVFNGTSSKLNAATFAPWFALPTVDSHLRMVEAGTLLADADLGEMFYNFMLDERLRPYSALDLRKYFPAIIARGACLYTWNRLLMGFRPSPYIATRHLLCARRYLLGDRFDKDNPFCWEKVVLNLPGMDDYDPRRPWVYKQRFDGRIAGDLIVYIDDLRISCPDLLLLWEAVQQVASRLNFLGMQHAARKLRDMTQKPGPWAGSVVNTEDGVFILTSQEKWDKTRRILKELEAQVKEGKINTVDLLSWRGFLIYVSRTYHMMKPYLKGLHLTVDSWRPERGSDGWKLRNADIDLLRRENEGFERVIEKPEGAPEWVAPVDRLAGDVHALLELCSADHPPKRRMRVTEMDAVFYVGGDASKVGYGSAAQRKTLRGKPLVTHNRVGFWVESIREGKRSNWKELRNCVGAVEEGVLGGTMRGCEVFLFTDNSVAERAYYKGTSSDKHLFELVLRLRKLAMRAELILHVVHIAGTRMIRMGIDGLSRGDTHEGVASGSNMVEFMDLHRDAFTRSPALKIWIDEIWNSELWGRLHQLTKEEWFTHDEECAMCQALAWVPPPAAADVCVEQMAFWRQHSPHQHTHVVICPRLFTCLWRKQLGKACDVLIEVPLLCLERVWGTYTHFEPLLIGLSFPVFNRPPYQLGLKPELMDFVEVHLSSLRKTPTESAFKHFLRELWSKAKQYSNDV